MKNVVYRIVHNDINTHDTTFANFTWDVWCQINNCILVTRVVPTYCEGVKTVFSHLESINIKYNKIFIIDATAVIKWNCPNIFISLYTRSSVNANSLSAKFNLCEV